MKLKIDGQEIELSEPTTIFHAAEQLGIDIPVMCYQKGYDYFTSCMICVVKDQTSGRVFPACSAEATEGMDIETQEASIKEARKSTLELLLSEHVGDCEAPCQRVCPIHMEVPLMIRQIMEGDLESAIKTIRLDMPIPSLLERYCNAPCENGCRRSKYDEGLAIRHLTRYAADWDIERENSHIPPRKAPSGKTVALIGAGPTGMSAAQYLSMEGHSCTVYEKAAKAGGRIHTEFDGELLDDRILAGEMKILRGLDIDFRFEQELGVGELTLDALREQYDAVVLTCGKTELEVFEAWGLAVTKKGPKVNAKTCLTPTKGVFAGGSVVKPGLPLIKSVTTAKTLATCASQYLNGLPVTGIYEKYNHTMGRLLDGEIDTFVSGADARPRLKPHELEFKGYLPEEAKSEATRCMHCDCREMHNCRLRDYSDEYGAKQSMFKGEERAEFVHVNQEAGAVYEPGKCIKCGLCVRVTKAEGEEFGFTFVGRGFDLKTAVPLNKRLNEGLEEVADLVVVACPTGALATNEKYEPLIPIFKKSDRKKQDSITEPIEV